MVLIQGIKTLPIVDEVVLHGDHVELIESRLVVHVANPVAVQRQSLQIVKMAEFDDFIPRFDVVPLQVDKFEQFEVLLGHRVEATDLVAVVADQVQLLDVGEHGRQGKDLGPVKRHFNENNFAQHHVDHLSHIFTF